MSRLTVSVQNLRIPAEFVDLADFIDQTRSTQHLDIGSSG